MGLIDLSGEGPFSTLGRWADKQSILNKRRYVLHQRTLALLGVISTGVSLAEIPGQRYLLSASLGLMAVLSLMSIASTRERNWYLLRALAESIKSLEWRIMMGLFGSDSNLAESRLQELWTSFRDDLPADLRIDAVSAIIPGEMTSICDQGSTMSHEEKKSRYLSDRITSQRTWYSGKARQHVSRWTRLKGGTASALALVLILVLADRWLQSTVPVMLAIVAFLNAENTTAQNGTVAVAYSVASEELVEIERQMEKIAEPDWAQFVGDSEESISREHVSWRVSRGVAKGQIGGV